MKILVVGSGGREHAIVKALKKSIHTTKLFCAPGNGGISEDAECVNIRPTDIPLVVGYCEQYGIDLCVVAPDDPLVLGMADALNEAGIPVFGPSKAAARIEGSKVFAKELMKKYGIPTAAYEVFDDADKALAYCDTAAYPMVIKAEGLALGKGVIIAEDINAAKSGIISIMRDRVFGESGSRIVIEEYLTGPEVSVLAFTDGETIKPMVSSMDHKRAYDGNEGPNTGGMGTISPNPHYTDEMAERCMDEIFLPTIRAMKQEGCPFQGCLYFGLMLTKQGAKVIEYNCRFGDPETQVVLPRLKTDLVEIMLACQAGKLHEIEIEWDKNACVCVVMASGGYPGRYETGKVITIPELDPDVTVYHAGTRLTDGVLTTNGGRVLGVTAKARSLKKAREQAYEAVERIHFEGAHYRKDIGLN